MSQPRKTRQRKRKSVPGTRSLTTVRGALVFGYSVITGLGSGWITLAMHRSIGAAAVSGVAAFAAALKLINDLIE
jgi:hypothetical protein